VTGSMIRILGAGNDIDKQRGEFIQLPNFYGDYVYFIFFLLMHVYIYIWHLTGFHESLLDGI
jgi:hypothetical protein